MEEDQLLERLVELKGEHRDMDSVIAKLQKAIPVDFLQIQRLKKRKLLLKDMIEKYESDLLPDIIA